MPLLCDIAMILMNFHTLLTNLLTQCTPVPVPFFCCFSISGFPHIKSAPKIWENPIKNQRTGSFGNHQGGLEGTHQGPRRPPGTPQGGAAPGGRLDPWWTPWLPPFAYIFLVPRNPRDGNPFS